MSYNPTAINQAILDSLVSTFTQVKTYLDTKDGDLSALIAQLRSDIQALQTLTSSDDVNLDTVQEIVDAIKTVETSLATILVNDLTTGGATKALTAEQGKILKGLIDDTNLNLTSITNRVAALESGQEGLKNSIASAESQIKGLFSVVENS